MLGTEDVMKNSKSEARNKSEIRMFKTRLFRTSKFRASNLFRVSVFDIRILFSITKYPPLCVTTVNKG